MNNVTFSGHTCGDVYTAEGGKWGAVTVAVRRAYKNKETGKYDADFVRVVLSEQQTKFAAQYLQKGAGVEVRGHLVSRMEEKDGKKSTVLGVRADEISFAPGSGTSGASGAPAANKPAAAKPAAPAEGFEELVGDDDELPF